MEVKLNKQLRNARMWVDENGFSRVEYNVGGRLSLEDAVELVDTVGEFREALTLGNRPHYIIVDDRGIHSMSRQARVTFAKPDDQCTTGGVAVIIRSKISEAIGNFVIKVSRTEYPTHLFLNEENGVVWLKSLR